MYPLPTRISGQESEAHSLPKLPDLEQSISGEQPKAEGSQMSEQVQGCRECKELTEHRLTCVLNRSANVRCLVQDTDRVALGDEAYAARDQTEKPRSDKGKHHHVAGILQEDVDEAEN